ncbi:MAG: RimK family alpha-L-glutamate ligase [Methanothrix sp.]|nr:RimK family alpha-L-glutamate ligase [Methanothrix sp.]
MHIGIVVSDPKDWTARALMASFTGNGAQAVFLNFSELTSTIDCKTIDGMGGKSASCGLSFCSGGVDLRQLDALVVRDLGRRGAQDVAFRFEALQVLESLGLPVINPPQAIARAANKFATSQALQRAGVPTPRTAVSTSQKDAAVILQEYGKAVSKPLFGFKGKGIEKLRSGDEGDTAKLAAILEKDGLVYLQEFIAFHSPRDIRAFVVNGKLMGAIYRVAPPGQWITNLARGGRAEPCPVTDELRDIAVSASRAVGAVYCGVDLLETGEGLKVIEVNGTPSGKGIFEASGVNVTDAIAEHVLRQRS